MRKQDFINIVLVFVVGTFFFLWPPVLFTYQNSTFLLQKSRGTFCKSFCCVTSTKTKSFSFGIDNPNVNENDRITALNFKRLSELNFGHLPVPNINTSDFVYY